MFKKSEKQEPRARQHPSPTHPLLIYGEVALLSAIFVRTPKDLILGSWGLHPRGGAHGGSGGVLGNPGPPRFPLLRPRPRGIPLPGAAAGARPA